MLVPSKECIGLNNQGVEYLMNYPMNGEKGLNKAVDLFKQAIKCDSSYTIAYINLSTAYDHNHHYKEEMVIVNKILVLTNNDPAILLQKGMLFEKLGDVDSAKITYNLTNTGYEKKLAKHPNNVGVIEGVIQLKAITDGKDAAMKELDEQIKAHPKLSSQLTWEYEFYKYFDRHAFIYGLTVEISSDN